MKDIKKYFDNFLKELKEVDSVDEAGLPIIARPGPEQAESLQKLVKKCYNKVQLNIKQIDGSISMIFKEFNELSLIHESKLGHALKDMQQFLEFY